MRHWILYLALSLAGHALVVAAVLLYLSLISLGGY